MANTQYSTTDLGSDSTPSVAALASDVRRVVLDNGLSILVKEVYPARVVSLGLWARVGSADESDDEAGTSHFLEHMLFKGTPSRPVGTIAQQVHGLGGHMNAFTSYDCTCYWMVVPSRHLDLAIDIQIDALLHSLFDQAEIARESEVILEEMRMYQDRPASYCNEKLLGVMFPHSPYGRPIIGREAIIRTMDRGKLTGYYGRLYRPPSLSCVVVGDVRTEAVVQQLSRCLAAIPGVAAPVRPWPAEPPQDAPRRMDLSGPIKSSHVQVGYRLPPILSQETYACDLLGSVLGGGRSSRLYQSLRERQGLVSQIGCSTSSEREEGMLIIESVVGPGQTIEAVVAGIEAEVERLLQDGVDEAELQKAKNMVEAAYVFSQETVEGQGRKLGYGEMLGDYTLAERYVHELYRVTPDEVMARARQYLRPANRSVVTYAAE